MIVIYSYCTITKTICYYYTQIIIIIEKCVMVQMFNNLKDRKIIVAACHLYLQISYLDY